jgi:hypothetical protein
MQYPRICNAVAIDDHVLIVEFDNQEIKQYDASKLLDKPMFALLQNPAFFKNFKVEARGYGIVWNEDIDISEYELWKNGTPIDDATNLTYRHVSLKTTNESSFTSRSPCARTEVK